MDDKAKKFWAWFTEHNISYLNINDIDEDKKEQLLDELLNHLHEYCTRLYFQVGGMSGEKQELIITAEGNADYFDQVEVFVNNAPPIDNWSFIAFIQPENDLVTTKFEDVELMPTEMWFLPLDNAGKPKSIGIKVLTPNYEIVKESEWFKSAVFKVLDTLLGEKSFALDIDYVDFGKLPDNPAEAGMIALDELPAYVKWKKSKRVI
jgi:hypothetical protein